MSPFSVWLIKREPSFSARKGYGIISHSSGQQIETNNDGPFRVHQREYINRIAAIKITAWNQFTSARAKLQWLTNDRPDICCSVAKACQVTKEMFERGDVEQGKNLNKVIRHCLLEHLLRHLAPQGNWRSMPQVPQAGQEHFEDSMLLGCILGEQI